MADPISCRRADALTDRTGQPVLQVQGLHGHYGESHVLHGMDFQVNDGEILTLLGRNGAGKTTTLRAITGTLARRTGSIRLHGQETITLAPERIARLGLGYCPEERGIFASLSVRENLLLPPLGPGGWSLDDIYGIFPRLKERAASQGTKLSGGEQQMLAIARILRTGAKLLLLDEPTEGLAPVIVQHIGRIILDLKNRGYTIILVEQNFKFAAKLADRHVVVDHGRVVDIIARSELDSQSSKLAAYLGV